VVVLLALLLAVCVVRRGTRRVVRVLCFRCAVPFPRTVFVVVVIVFVVVVVFVAAPALLGAVARA
jgi:hypothetical protein